MAEWRTDPYDRRLDSQSEDEYAAYKTRACFFGATARALGEYLDLIFRRTPLISSSDPLNSSPSLNFQPSTLNSFLADCDLWVTSFLTYARQTVSEILSVGRAGSLVTFENNRPVLTMFRAEHIRQSCRASRSALELRSRPSFF